MALDELCLHTTRDQRKMKRHEKLIPLSRFHRSCLFLALMAKKNAPDIKSYPTDLQGKIDYVNSFYQNQLIVHFKKEEQLWNLVIDESAALKKIIVDLTDERKRVVALFEALAVKPEASCLHTIGIDLEKHVRKEERIRFQQIQEEFTNEELANLHF